MSRDFLAYRARAAVRASARTLTLVLAALSLPALSGVWHVVAAQPVSRAQGPAASVTSAAPQTGDTGTVSYDVGGVRVIQRFATTSEIVVANLYLLGGLRQVTRENAGIELLLLDASERGTRTYPREQLRRAMARQGTLISTTVSTDWSSIGLRATRATFDSTWAVLASRVMEPRLDSADVELLRRQMLAAVRQRHDSPDALLEHLADSVAFEGHPYALAPVGTEHSLARISLGDLRRYHQTQVVKSRMLLVVVGNISRAKIERAVQQTLARLPAGGYAWTLPDTLPRRPAAVTVVERTLPTNYVLGLYAGPRGGTREYHALRIATAILSGQLFAEVRSRRNLTYAVDAPFVERAVAVGGLYVTTVYPRETLEVMQQTLRALKTGTVDEGALERLIQQFATQYFLDNESAAEQANFLARAHLYHGDYRVAERFRDELRQVTPADIRTAAQRYMRDVQFVYIGDGKRAPTAVMERF